MGMKPKRETKSKTQRKRVTTEEAEGVRARNGALMSWPFTVLRLPDGHQPEPVRRPLVPVGLSSDDRSFCRIRCRYTNKGEGFSPVGRKWIAGGFSPLSLSVSCHPQFPFVLRTYGRICACVVVGTA